MKLTFIGTKGYIKETSTYHRMHTSLLATYRGKRLMIDCGEDWLGKVNEVCPHAVIITHAHPDHAWGLKGGVSCPVYATVEAWKEMELYPIKDRQVARPGIPFDVFGFSLEAFPVEHSVLSPAVGYRVKAGKVTIFYVPDVVYIHDKKKALSGVSLYIGDGASLSTPMIRRREGALIGHAPISTQLTWCAKEGIERAIITHCGPDVIAAGYDAAAAKVKELGAKRGVSAGLAYDGLEFVLRG